MPVSCFHLPFFAPLPHPDSPSTLPVRFGPAPSCLPLFAAEGNWERRFSKLEQEELCLSLRARHFSLLQQLFAEQMHGVDLPWKTGLGVLAVLACSSPGLFCHLF